MNLRLVWSTQQAPGQARLYNETLSQKHKQPQQKDTFTVFRQLKFSIVFLNLAQSIKL